MEYCYPRVGRGVPQSTTEPNGVDKRWLANAAAARTAGLGIGGYWRFFPDQDFERQVNLFTQQLAAAQPLTLPPWVDLEDTGGLDPTQLTFWAIQALEWVEEIAKVPPVLYTNRSFLRDRLQADRLLPRWQLALAAYVDQTEWIDARATWWQWAQNVRPDWATGPVDLQRHRGALA